MIWSFPDLVRKQPWFQNYFVEELNDSVYDLSTTMTGGHNLENSYKATIEIFSTIGIKSWLDAHPCVSNRLTLFLYLDVNEPRWVFKKLKYS